MAGTKRTPKAPPWFDSESYRPAETLDAGDWLLNLSLRCWLNHEPNPQTEAALRSVGPVLRRGDASQIDAMHLADRHRWKAEYKLDSGDAFAAFEEACRRPSLPDDVRRALLAGRVKSGIAPLGVAEMYIFERMLPDKVRKAGAAFSPDDPAWLHPREFGGVLDDAFGPGLAHQMTGRFVRVDLVLPDDVLHADLQQYLATERRRLAAMGGPQKYREASRLVANSHPVRTLATIGLLPFLDLDRWQRIEGRCLSFHAVREMAHIGKEHERSLRHRVSMANHQMKLHAWFARLDRSVSVAGRKREKAT